jgi:hypothetical protein
VRESHCARVAEGGFLEVPKSLFASFSSEKEDSSFFEKKEAKKLLFPALASRGES